MIIDSRRAGTSLRSGQASFSFYGFCLFGVEVVPLAQLSHLGDEIEKNKIFFGGTES